MRIAVISDIHANLEAFQEFMDDISEHHVDRIVCLGDIVGYNTNPNECIDLVRQYDSLCVAGNHDRAASGQITTEGFSVTATRAIAWTRRRLRADNLDFLRGLPLQASIQNHLVAVHGALHPDTGNEMVRLDNDERRLLSLEALVAHPSGARVCAFGHTHRLGIFELRNGIVQVYTDDEVILRKDAYYLINPGTIGEPRTTDRRATYLVLDTVRQMVTARYVGYDSLATLEKTRKAGLLPRSSYFPPPVRTVTKQVLRALGLYDIVRRVVD